MWFRRRHLHVVTVPDSLVQIEADAPVRWVDDSPPGSLAISVEHCDGVPWYKAPVPPPDHVCTPQTRGYTGYVNYIERCACGARRHYTNDSWSGRNSR